MEFTGRNIVVTGAGRGIGEALAREFHDRGANVVVVDLAGADAVVASLERATAITADVSTEAGNKDVSGSNVLKAAGVVMEMRFFVLPHPEVADYMALKATDPQRWLGGMRKLQRRTIGA